MHGSSAINQLGSARFYLRVHGGQSCGMQFMQSCCHAVPHLHNQPGCIHKAAGVSPCVASCDGGRSPFSLVGEPRAQQGGHVSSQR